MGPGREGGQVGCGIKQNSWDVTVAQSQRGALETVDQTLRVILIRGKEALVVILPWSLTNDCPEEGGGQKFPGTLTLWTHTKRSRCWLLDLKALCVHNNGKGTIRRDMGTMHRADCKRKPEVTVTSGSSQHPLGLGEQREVEGIRT